MRVINSQYRDVFTQENDFVFDFRISEYTSNNFSVGLSGSKFLGLHFRSGLVYDWSGNMVGAFNGQPISFEATRHTGRVSYSINDVPVNRNIIETPTFNKIVVNHVETGTLEIKANLRGELPVLVFDNLISNSGISGRYFNSSNYPLKIYNVTSNDYPGNWIFDEDVSDTGYGSFYLTGVSTLTSGQVVTIDFDANFGRHSYNLPVDSVVFSGRTQEEYSFASIELASGNSKIFTSPQEFLFSVPYLTSSDYLNLYFNYTEGQTGNALVFRTGLTTGRYSGWLNAISGYASGTLYADDISGFTELYTLDAYNTGNVTFFPPSSVTHQAYATGQVTHTYNYYEDLVNGLDVPLPTASIQAGNYSTDLGGFFGTRAEAGNTYKFWLNLSAYSGDRNLTGNITNSSMSGRYVFSSDSYLANGLFKREVEIVSSYTGRIFTGTIYRGTAYCFLPDDYSFPFTGQFSTSLGTFTITGNMNSQYNCMLFKNVHTTSGSGYYVFSGEVSGKVLMKERSYFLYSGAFGLPEIPTNAFATGFTVFRHFLRQGMAAFDKENLNPFSVLTDTKTRLYAQDIVDLGTFRPTGNPYDFDGQSFVSHPILLPNNVQYEPHNIRFGPTYNFATPVWYNVLKTDFTGTLPYPITGYIQRGDFRHYLQDGTYSGMFLEEPQSEYANIPLHQGDKLNINTLYTHLFNGEDPYLQAKKYIYFVDYPTGVNQVLDPPYTGFLQSGYFSITDSDTGISSSGLFHNFNKDMISVWNVGVGDNFEGPFQSINIPPFIDGNSRYRMENIPIVGDAEKYIRVVYTDAGYTNVSGGSDQATISFTLSPYSGTKVIE